MAEYSLLPHQEFHSPYSPYSPIAGIENVQLQNDEFDGEMNRYLDVNNFTIEYVQFPLQITKKQVRRKDQPNQQRLNPKEANIKLHLLFESNVDFNNIFKIHLKVRRAHDVPNYIELYSGFVTLDQSNTNFFQQEDGSKNKIVLYANLDSPVEEDCDKNIYQLSKNDQKLNEFNLLIEVLFHDGTRSNFTSRSYTVVGQKCGDKRKCPDSSPDNKDTVFERFRDPNETKHFANHQRIVCELIDAKTGLFENLKANVIKSGKGDIAYHFILKDQSSQEEYKPGEIIGFKIDGSGKVIIDKLSPSNAKESFLKGVVTESQYIEANLPKDQNVITATVCMLGVVPVRVMGPVIPGKGLLASKDIPGTAISESFVDSPKTGALIGYAFERIDCPQDMINDAKALVSIISGAGHELVERQLSILEKSLKSSIKFNTRRSRKCFALLGTIMVLFCILLGTYVYQVKATGTLYQQWKCKQNSIGTCKYWHWLSGGEYVGLQFKSCKLAWEKTLSKRRFFRRPHSKDSPPKCINSTKKYNYYINLDSCSGRMIPGAKYMFAVDEGCNSLVLFDEVDGKWKVSDKVCFKPRCNIECSNINIKRKCNDSWGKCKNVL